MNKKTRNERNCIFISHSTKDVSLGKALVELLKQLINDQSSTEEIFFAPENMDEANEWRKTIIEKIKRTKWFIVLVTPNSIENKWVNFEIGLAFAMGIKKDHIIAIGNTDIPFNKLTIFEKQVKDIKKRENIKLLLQQLFSISDKDIGKWCRKNENKDLIDDVIHTSTQKTVYIVGSKPQEEFEGNVNRWNQKRVDFFVKNISIELLKKGFTLSSFPTVEEVGKTVAEIAMDDSSSKYVISGLYDFDKLTEKVAINDDSKANWERMLNKYRKDYLEEKDIIIIIGGGPSTRKEALVASNVTGLQIFPIPCFGGYGEKLFNHLLEDGKFNGYDFPCCNCISHKANCKRIPDIITRCENYRFMNKQGEWDHIF